MRQAIDAGVKAAEESIEYQRKSRCQAGRTELAVQLMVGLLAGGRRSAEPSLWITAFALADAMPAYRDATVIEHAEGGVA